MRLKDKQLPRHNALPANRNASSKLPPEVVINPLEVKVASNKPLSMLANKGQGRFRKKAIHVTYIGSKDFPGAAPEVEVIHVDATHVKEIVNVSRAWSLAESNGPDNTVSIVTVYPVMPKGSSIFGEVACRVQLQFQLAKMRVIFEVKSARP